MDESRVEALQREGKTVVLVMLDKDLLGLVAVSDRPRPEARRTVRALQSMGIQVREEEKGRKGEGGSGVERR